MKRSFASDTCMQTDLIGVNSLTFIDKKRLKKCFSQLRRSLNFSRKLEFSWTITILTQIMS